MEQSSVRIAEEPISMLGRLGEVPIAFLVESVLDLSLVEDGLGGIVFSERAVVRRAQRPRRPVGHPSPSRSPLVGHRIAAVRCRRSVGS
jgi:hypothetical protein